MLLRLSFEADPTNPKQQKPVFATNGISDQRKSSTIVTQSVVLASIVETDDEASSPPVVLESMPSSITPVNIRRRRKTT